MDRLLAAARASVSFKLIALRAHKIPLTAPYFVLGLVLFSKSDGFRLLATFANSFLLSDSGNVFFSAAKNLYPINM